MSSPPSNGQPNRGDNRLDWLSANEALAVSGEPGDLTVEVKAPSAVIEFTKPPPSGKLTIDSSAALRLRAVPDVRVPDDFTLCLIVDDRVETVCQLDAEVSHIVCSARQSSRRRRRHHMELQFSSKIEILGGDWFFEAPPKTPRAQLAPLALRADNREVQLRIVAYLPVLELDSFGTHEFELYEQHNGSATFRVHDGTATFRADSQGSRRGGRRQSPSLGQRHQLPYSSGRRCRNARRDRGLHN